MKEKKERLLNDLKTSMKKQAWMEKALNPEGQLPIIEVSISSLPTEIPNRVKRMIEDWVSNGKCRDEIAAMESAMAKHFEEMQRKLIDIERKLIFKDESGSATSDSSISVGHVLGVVASAPLWIPILVLGTVLALGISLILTPYVIYKAVTQSSEESRMQLIQLIYDKVIAKVDNKVLQKAIDHAAEPVEKQIKECFEVYIPNHVTAIQRMIEKYSTNEKKLDEKRELFKKINDKFVSGRIQLASLREQFDL
jgi:hypothetical protein